MLSEGREDENDEERAGRPSTSTRDENIDEVKKIVLVNHRITLREVAEDRGHATVRREIRTKIAQFRPKTASH